MVMKQCKNSTNLMVEKVEVQSEKRKYACHYRCCSTNVKYWTEFLESWTWNLQQAISCNKSDDLQRTQRSAGNQEPLRRCVKLNVSQSTQRKRGNLTCFLSPSLRLCPLRAFVWKNYLHRGDRANRRNSFIAFFSLPSKLVLAVPVRFIFPKFRAHNSIKWHIKFRQKPG